MELVYKNLKNFAWHYEIPQPLPRYCASAIVLKWNNHKPNYYHYIPEKNPRIIHRKFLNSFLESQFSNFSKSDVKTNSSIYQLFFSLFQVLIILLILVFPEIRGFKKIIPHFSKDHPRLFLRNCMIVVIGLKSLTMTGNKGFF